MLKSNYYIAGYQITQGEFSVVGVSPFSPHEALTQLNMNTNFKCIMLALKESEIGSDKFKDLFNIYKSEQTRFPLVELRIELGEDEFYQLVNKNYEGIEHE
jgi:hypothetical protein